MGVGGGIWIMIFAPRQCPKGCLQTFPHFCNHGSEVRFNGSSLRFRPFSRCEAARLTRVVLLNCGRRCGGTRGLRTWRLRTWRLRLGICGLGFAAWDLTSRSAIRAPGLATADSATPAKAPARKFVTESSSPAWDRARTPSPPCRRGCCAVRSRSGTAGRRSRSADRNPSAGSPTTTSAAFPR